MGLARKLVVLGLGWCALNPSTWAEAASGIVPDDFPTIQRALDQAGPGDLIQVKDSAGPFFEKISFPRSGNQAEGFITLMAFPGHRPILDGTGVSGSDMVLIRSKSYIRLIGFKIRNNLGVNDGSGVRIVGAGSHVEVRDNRIHDMRGRDAMGITVYGTSRTASIRDLVIDGNEIFDIEPARSEALTLNGNVERFAVTNNIVRDVNNIGIDFIGGETDINPDPTKVARNGICRFNQVYRANANYGGGFAGGIYVDGARDIIIENNIVAGSDLGIEVAAENAGVVSSGIVVRNNIVYENEKVCLVFGGFDASVGRVRDSQFLYNTCYQNDTLGTGFGELWLQYAEDNDVRGNIFYGLGNTLLLSESGNVDNTLDYNLWYTPGGAASATFTWQGTTYDSYAAYRSASGQDGRSMFDDPRFERPRTKNFHVRSGSPAIDAGDPGVGSEVGNLDSDFDARVNGSRIDIGADEVTATGCAYDIMTLGEAFPRAGGRGSVQVAALAGCAWAIASLDGWITVNGGIASGPSTVRYSVAASNTGASSRTGTILVAGQPFTVAQLGSSSTPVITITSPTNGSTSRTTLASITVSGTALDDMSLRSVTWETDRGGRDRATGTTSWEADIALQDGRNVITVTATDSAGNRGIDVLTVRKVDEASAARGPGQGTSDEHRHRQPARRP